MPTAVSGGDVVVNGESLINSKIELQTAVATTSGTAIDFTGIPAGVKRINVSFIGISTNSTAELIIQLGDSGGFETTGYLGNAWQSNTSNKTYTDGFLIDAATGAVDVLHGVLTLVLHTGTTWVGTGTGGESNAVGSIVTGGSKELSGELTQLRLTTQGGAGTFDAGSINISWEF